MRSRPIACLLLCGVVLLAASPSRAFAQIEGQPADAPAVVSAGDAPAAPKPRLKELFAEGVAKKKVAAISEADLKRIEGARLFPQSPPKSASSLSKRDTVLIVVVMVVIVGLAIVVAHNAPDDLPPSCDFDPGNPECVP